MGSEGPVGRLDRSHLVVRQGDRIYIRGHEHLGFGQAEGPITLDNEGIWLVQFDRDSSGAFDYHLLVKAFDT
jgi:hypothetical protein